MNNKMVLALALALAGGTAHAAESTHAPDLRVPIADLPLANQDGRSALVRRVLRAARSYCEAYGQLIVSPGEARPQPCTSTMRIRLQDAMPADVRMAYAQGWQGR